MDDGFQKEIEERTNLSGTNKFELLLFRLGKMVGTNTDQLYGINVFKIREIVPMTRIVKSIGIQPPVLGMINLRGQIIPVIDLAAVVGSRPKDQLNILLVTEYGESVQAFAVEAVEDIARLDWSQVMSAEHSSNANVVSSIAKIESADGVSKLVQVLDVEQILATCLPKQAPPPMAAEKSLRYLLPSGAVILAADDSKVARAMIEHSMEMLDLPCHIVKTGLEAWSTLQSWSAQAQAAGTDIRDQVALVLTDIEMPEMDGFTLTRKIKTDPLLSVLPVLIHSSLSGAANQEHIKNAGADGYVTKFATDDLVKSLLRVLHKNPATSATSAGMLEIA